MSFWLLTIVTIQKKWVGVVSPFLPGHSLLISRSNLPGLSWTLQMTKQASSKLFCQKMRNTVWPLRLTKQQDSIYICQLDWTSFQVCDYLFRARPHIRSLCGRFCLGVIAILELLSQVWFVALTSPPLVLWNSFWRCGGFSNTTKNALNVYDLMQLIFLTFCTFVVSDLKPKCVQHFKSRHEVSCDSRFPSSAL